MLMYYFILITSIIRIIFYLINIKNKNFQFYSQFEFHHTQFFIVLSFGNVNLDIKVLCICSLFYYQLIS
jgi:hypothetical protein